MPMLLAEAEYPNAPLDLQLQIGWLALICAALLAVWAWSRAEPLRRALFAREDPRLFAMFRIGLGLITIQNFWNLNMHWRMLWTDEGLFTADETQRRLGRTALTGWTELDGFFDHWALLKFFWGKYSLLFIHSSPSFVQAYLAVLIAALVLFTIGFRTRITAVVCALLITSLYNRNAVYLEGHDTVFRCLWFMTLFARVDGAWSVDNWLRRKREARLASALERGPGVPYDWLHFADRSSHWLFAGAWAWAFCVIVDYELNSVTMIVLAGVSIAAIVGIVEREHRRARAAKGELEPGTPARFELIPAWPRYLFIAQLICIYSATGLYKTGGVWKRGDALYYALNMDHFYRFEVATQWVSVYLATNVFRFMTLVTLWWEKLFFLVAIGLIFRFREQVRDQDWYRAFDAIGWRKWLGRVALLGTYVVIYRVAILAYPWCIALQEDKSPTPAEPGLAVIHAVFAGVLPALILAWFVLGRWPIPVGKLLAKLPRMPGSVAGAKLDQVFVRKWVFGRRIWLGIGCFFHGMLLVTMNIGMFPVIMMWFYPVFFEAKPFLITGRWTADKLRKRKWTAFLAPRLLDDALSEDPQVLETSAASVRRDPTGPWWLNPWTLVVGAVSLVQTRSREALVSTAERGRSRGGRIPDVVVLGILGVAVALATLRGLEAKTEGDGKPKAEFVRPGTSVASGDRKEEAEARKERIDRLGDAGHWWVYVGLGLAFASHFRRRPPEDQVEAEAAPAETTPAETTPAETTPPRVAEPQLMGGTLARTLALGFSLYHCAAIGVTFIPRYSVTQAWRGEAVKVFGDYVRGINLSQSWKMFAPNPPRGNGFMRTVVVDVDGSPYQVGKDHYTDRPYVFWYNDRERKMHRRIIGKSKWYLRYWGQYHCRDWALNHDGQLPKEVRIIKLRTPIPKPEDLAAGGVPSNPRERKLRTELLETFKCDEDVLTPEMKLRRGWELSDKDRAKLEADVRQREITAEATRKQWATRKNFGGEEAEEDEP